jgi:hypothetical protein
MSGVKTIIEVGENCRIYGEFKKTLDSKIEEIIRIIQEHLIMTEVTARLVIQYKKSYSTYPYYEISVGDIHHIVE